MPEIVPCLCGSTNPPSRHVRAVDENSGEVFTYLTCPDCTLERLAPRPTLEEIWAYYPRHYAPHVGSSHFGAAEQVKRLVYDIFWAPDGEVPANIRRLRPLLRPALWPARNRSILAFVPPERRRVFEFGAAKATDLLAFRAAGWDVDGCEPSDQACALAAEQGILLQQATAETAVLADGAYGCILFNNVFEHVHDPLAVLLKCRQALTPGGLLMLLVPNHASLARLMFGASWPGYDAPRHIWGWTPTSIRPPLNAAGFAVEEIRHQANGTWMWRSMLDMRHSPGTPGPLRRLIARCAAPALPPLGSLAALLGYGDVIRVMARRV